MGDTTSLELLLDAESDAAVRAEWAALADAGMSSLGAHEAASNAPHVTLLARTSSVAHPLPLDDALLPMPLVLGAPMLFGSGDRRVLVRAVVPSAELLALHAAVLAAAGPGDDDPHVLPGAWTPHVTLARRLKVADVPEALALLGEGIPATSVTLRRWDAATRTVTRLAGA